MPWVGGAHADLHAGGLQAGMRATWEQSQANEEGSTVPKQPVLPKPHGCW